MPSRMSPTVKNELASPRSFDNTWYSTKHAAPISSMSYAPLPYAPISFIDVATVSL